MIRDFGGCFLQKRPANDEPTEKPESQNSSKGHSNHKFLVVDHQGIPTAKRLGKSNFIYREADELSLDDFKCTKWIPGPNLQELDSFQRYLEPLKTSKSDIKSQIVHSKANSHSSALTIDSPRKASTNFTSDRNADMDNGRCSPEAEFLNSGNFNEILRNKVAYLRNGFSFLKYYYQDSLKADIQQLSIRSTIPIEVLQYWIEQKHNIVSLLYLLQKDHP